MEVKTENPNNLKHNIINAEIGQINMMFCFNLGDKTIEQSEINGKQYFVVKGCGTMGWISRDDTGTAWKSCYYLTDKPELKGQKGLLLGFGEGTFLVEKLTKDKLILICLWKENVTTKHYFLKDKSYYKLSNKQRQKIYSK